MKYLFSFFITFLFSTAVIFGQSDTSGLPLTSIEYIKKDYNFGDVKTGEIVKHRFAFTNTGSENLYITWVKASCGCTTVDYSKEPILPGEEGFIDINFNLQGRVGHQLKFVWVQTNTDPYQHTMKIEGEAIE